MGTPAAHLPQPLSHEAINTLLTSLELPQAIQILSPSVTAQYHSIYALTLPPSPNNQSTSLILRVSGPQLPYIKTENEIGVMKWVSQNTTIPIPALIAYDSSSENAIGHEYTLLKRVDGVTLSEIYPDLDKGQINAVLDQLIDILVQLHAHEWVAIGGLRLRDGGEIVLAQVIDETFWQVPDVAQYWLKDETIASLNIGGPYPTYISYITAQIRTYIHLIRINEKLAFMRNIIPRLEAFVNVLPEYADALNNVKLVLAHKDIHFANILYSPASQEITAILDWEFSSIVPFPKWNARKSFLWNGRADDESMDEKRKWIEMWERRCRERGFDWEVFGGKGYTSERQEEMQLVADYLRAITEVVPRGQRGELVMGWKDVVLRNMARFGC